MGASGCGATEAPDCEISCSDRIDNDEDMMVDCDDIDCIASPACYATAFPSEFGCDNGVDDDDDDLVDCDDPDCDLTPECGHCQ